MNITKDWKRNVIKLIILIVISLCLEIFVFNIGSFRLIGKDYQSKTVSIEECQLKGLEKVGEGIYTVVEENPGIEIKDINEECGTIYLDFQKQEELTLMISFSDETSEGYRNLPIQTIYTDMERTKYSTLHLSGNVNKLHITLDLAIGDTLELKEIRFNEQIPFQFQPLRFVLIFGVLAGITALFTAKILDEKWNIKDPKQNGITYFLGLGICILFATYSVLSSASRSILVNLETTPYHNYIYDVVYTTSLSNGSLQLLMEVDESLLQLENPYDETARIAIDFKQIYDYVYYDGAYYVYFSILPQLILVPFHLITGQYLNSLWLMIAFMILGVISTIKLITLVFKTWFPETKFRMYILAILFVLFSNTLLYTISTAAVYELVAVLGYWLITGGIYHIFKALREPEKILYKDLAIGCLMMACAVSARPNLIIISLFVLPIFIRFFVNLAKQKERRKDWIKFTLAVILPYGIIGTILMILNYVRFDSITEFGAIYQLTSNDMAKLGYRISTIPIGIWHYFFNPADINLEFPFIHTRSNMPQYMGFYGSGFAGVGIFMLMPICILIFFLPTLKKEIQEKYPNLWFLILDAIFVAVLSAIAVTLVGASYYRYSLDFIWLMSMVGICLMMVVYQRLKKEELLTKIFEKVCIVLAIYAICITLGVSIRSESNFLQRVHTLDYYTIKESISFWE